MLFSLRFLYPLYFSISPRRFLKPKDLTVSLWKQNSLKLISPFIFLILTLLCMSGFGSFNLPTDDLIKPAFNVSFAWIAYRLVGIFTTNRAWLELLPSFVRASCSPKFRNSLRYPNFGMISLQFEKGKFPS